MELHTVTTKVKLVHVICARSPSVETKYMTEFDQNRSNRGQERAGNAAGPEAGNAATAARKNRECEGPRLDRMTTSRVCSLGGHFSVQSCNSAMPVGVSLRPRP